MKTPSRLLFTVLLSLAGMHALAAAPPPAMTPRQMDAALAALSGNDLRLSSPRMTAFLGRAFPRGGEETCEGPFDGTGTENNCQWFGTIDGADPSPWPRFLLFFEDNRLVSVVTGDAAALRRSPQWRCRPVPARRNNGYVDCVRADVPAGRVARLRRAHAAMMNAAD